MKRIGRYIIRGLLGRGGMGKVYKVELPPIGKIAALKLLDPDPLLIKLMGIGQLRTLFIKEAVTMAGLRHPNIVEIHDFDEDNGNPFYVMDFFANNLGVMMGESYLMENPSRIIHADKALNYVRQTLNGISSLHDANILHRDIKPFNLLVTDQDTVKICDFGLSKLRGETFCGPSNLNVGSPYYAAPEQERDPDSVDMRADLYPVGIMLYRMLTGRLPNMDASPAAYEPTDRFNSDLDHHWDAFIRRAIAAKPEQRFPNAPAMRGALKELEKHWRRHKERSCRMPQTDHQQPDRPAQAVGAARPRYLPIKSGPRQAAELFGVDPLWRPKVYLDNRFDIQNGHTVMDHASGLLWQQAGSAYPRTWQQAHQYIRQLNSERFGERHNWRLPTIDELLTLLRPNPQGEALCIAPVFDVTQRRIWSIDRRSFLYAYYADLDLGFVGWQDFSAPNYVRAVCGAAPSQNPQIEVQPRIS